LRNCWNRPAHVALHGVLHVALEHLERERDPAAAPPHALEERVLEPVRVRIVVLLADEDDVGPGEARDHHLEVDELALARVVDALGDVAA
jgi:hypothetical protein